MGVIKTEKKGSAIIVTINRPDKLNALNQHTMEELNEAIGAAEIDTDVKGIIITGEGAKAFVAGADISEFQDLDMTRAEEFARKGQVLFQTIEDLTKPVIAAVNGFALGGGCELALACHMRLASSNASFGQPEVNLGIIPGYGGTQRLTSLVGKGKAIELMTTGDIISADEAMKIGLVNHVYELGDLLDKALELIEKIATKSPIAVSYVISSVNNFGTNEDGYHLEAEAFGICSATEDFNEGVAAFVEKRQPNFKGK